MEESHNHPDPTGRPTKKVVEGLCCAAVEPEVVQFPEANHKVGDPKKRKLMELREIS